MMIHGWLFALPIDRAFLYSGYQKQVALFNTPTSLVDESTKDGGKGRGDWRQKKKQQPFEKVILHCA